MTGKTDSSAGRHARPSVADLAQVQRHDAPTGQETLLTRRRFLYGAIGVGAAAAVGIGAAAYSASSDDASNEIDFLEVPQSALVTLNDLAPLDNPDAKARLVGSFDIPYGTLVWANDDAIAACLLPTETGSPLAQIGLLSLGSGALDTVVDKARGAAEGYEIYDVRANSAGLIWTEANILQGTWRIWTAPLAGGMPGEARLLEAGDDAYDVPTLAVALDKAYWQVLPKAPNAEGLASRLMSAAFSGGEAKTVLESARRMGTPVYGGSDRVTTAVRLDVPSTYYQLTTMSAGDDAVLDSLTLPAAVRPLEAGYGASGFAFSLADIYDREGGISNLGTYTPLRKPESGGYSATEWFGFARTPTAPPAWSGGLFIVKSTYSVCGVDFSDGTYFAIDVENGADTYGEYLASTGEHDTFVTYTNIDHTPVGGEPIHACRVKVWSPLV